MRPFKISITKSRTINLGNYESTKLDLQVEERFVEEDGYDKETAYKEIKDFVDKKLDEMVQEVIENHKK